MDAQNSVSIYIMLYVKLFSVLSNFSTVGLGTLLKLLVQLVCFYFLAFFFLFLFFPFPFQVRRALLKYNLYIT